MESTTQFAETTEKVQVIVFSSFLFFKPVALLSCESNMMY